MTNYIPIRRPGCILFEYDPDRMLIRIKRGGDMHLVDLVAEEAEAAEKVSLLEVGEGFAALTANGGERPFTKDEAIAAVKDGAAEQGVSKT